MATARRPLDFRSYDELLADVTRLRERGYDRAGRWELPEMLVHLARTMDVVSDPSSKPLPRPARWAVRTVVLPRILRRRRIPTGVSMPKALRLAAVPTADEAPSAFVTSLARARSLAGPAVFHPAMGTIPLDAWHQLQLIHAAHHLSFLVPR